MGGGNGAKAAKARERNKKAEGPKANSILKEKDKMLNIVCGVCRVRCALLARVVVGFAYVLRVRVGRFHEHGSCAYIGTYLRDVCAWGVDCLWHGLGPIRSD
jgi:anaerobic selenocysteine-containing dehydrogenase